MKGEMGGDLIMPKEQSFIEIVDELIAEDKKIIDEFLKEEMKPMVDYNKAQERKLFESAYKEVLKLEEV